MTQEQLEAMSDDELRALADRAHRDWVDAESEQARRLEIARGRKGDWFARTAITKEQKA